MGSGTKLSLELKPTKVYQDREPMSRERVLRVETKSTIQEKKKKIDKFNIIKIKNSYSAKDPVKRMKRQSTVR